MQELFASNYQSILLTEFIVKIIQERTELRHKNHNEMLIIKERENQIRRIEETLKELNVVINTEYENEDWY